MCGRFTLWLQFGDLVKAFPEFEFTEELSPRYNIAPSQPVAVVPNDGSRRVRLFQWGLVPFWAKDPKIGYRLINARAETLARTLRRPKLQPGEVARWLLYFVVGGLGVSLGIAYILTHLYRQKHFPEWVWYATLQFIPRETRGIIFIAVGLGILSVALWGVYRGITNGQAAKRSQERR